MRRRPQSSHTAVIGAPHLGTSLRTAILLALFFFHPAAQSAIGKAYFYVTGLNNVYAEVTPRVFLQPAIVLVALLVACSPGLFRRRRAGRKCGIGVGLALWFVGATLSFAANVHAELGAVTYVTVFVSAALVYVVLRKVELTDRQFNLVFIALAGGSLFPLLTGMMAFYGTWGVPSFSTVTTVHTSAQGIQAYEDVTFGSRGNTASFLLIVGPPLAALACEKGKSRLLRLFWNVCVVLVLLNFMILQQRAAIVAFLLSLAVLWGFKSRPGSGYAMFTAAFVIAFHAILNLAPEAGDLIAARFMPALTWDTEADTSVYGRTESMKEGVELALDNLPFGIGPGAALVRHSQWSAHQFNIQQAMETGVVGFVGSLIFAVGVLVFLVRAVSHRSHTALTKKRFVLTIGPATYVAYGLIANMTLNNGYVNTWIVLAVAMLALAPPIENRKSEDVRI